MCDICRKIEADLTRYRRIMAGFDDPEVVRSITGLIDEAEAEKLAMHAVLRRDPASVR
jgi:hypothetical protein